MYSSSSFLSLRAKGSLYHHHHQCCFSGDWQTERCGCCGCRRCSLGTAQSLCPPSARFSDRFIFANPRLLYGYWLRQSALIRWAPSRIVVSGGGGGGAAVAGRYRRLTAAWNGEPCATGGWRRWSKSSSRRVSSVGGDSDGCFQEMLGLLAEVEECFREDAGTAAGGAAEDTYVKEKVGLRRRCYDEERDSSAEDDRVAWGSELCSSYPSASSVSSISGDSRRSKVLSRRARDASSNRYGRNDEVAEKEVREVQKREDDSRSRRRYRASDSIVNLDSDTKKRESKIERGKDNAASLTGSAHQSREQYVQEGRHFTGQKESKEELQKVSTSHLRQSSATERNIGDKKTFGVVKEETSAAHLLEVVKRQQNEIERLTKDYQNLLRTTQVHNVNSTQTSASRSIYNTRVENLGETSTLPMGVLEEVRRQRSEIDKLNENYQKLMRAYKMQESNVIRELNSEKSFGTTLEIREESSTSAVNLVEEGRVRYEAMDKQTNYDSRAASLRLTRRNELQKSHQELKTSGIHESHVGTSSNYKKNQGTILEDREREAVSAINLVEEVQGHHTNVTQGYQNIRQTDLGVSSHKLTERENIHSKSSELASRPQRHYVTRTGDQQERTSLAVSLTEEREEQVSNINEKVSGQVDSRKNSQKLTDTAEIHKNSVIKASKTQDLVNTTVKDQEESLTSVQHLVKLTRNEKVKIDQQVIEEVNISRDTQTRINNMSEAFKGEHDNAIATFSEHGKNAVSASNLVHKVQQPIKEDGEQATQQLTLQNDSYRRVSESFEGGSVNISDLQTSSSTGTKSGDDYSSLILAQEVKGGRKINLVEETFGTSSGTSESWYSSGPMQTHELDHHTKSDGFHLVKYDVLESARRLDKSSSHYVGEFIDQLHQKVSASEETDTTSFNSPETQTEASRSSPLQKPKATAEHETEAVKKEGPLQYSARSEAAGPSDEIWDVRGASSQEPSPTEEPEDSSSVRIQGTMSAPASTSGAIIKRSSRSLWSYIADVVLMGWRPHTSSQKSMLKSGTRSSSNESVNSEGWYSGHEPEDDHEENVKNGRVVTKKELELNKSAASKPHSRTSSVSGQVSSEVRRQGKQIMQVELDVSNPIESTGGSYGSNGSPPAPSLEKLVPVDSGKAVEGIPSAAATASQSALFGSTSVSTSEEETEMDRVHVAEVGLIKSGEEQKTERISEIVVIEGKDVELKRRKLQRKKQVLREEFEKWEEAYKLESEQRKIDEIFMREALLEAKKAADMWEVPVGAVLVQDGKIIARGCNLVEDLRDSTAHAEMICIREASNLLRTWRLAGTTLYVTLEPCPMCAGAILQARIDVVVWGAPNKLLGADGSWIRLFPGGEEGKQDLDQSNQMVGPVHPFHPKITIRRGVLAMECADAMQQFFQLRRKKKKPEPPPPSCLPISYPAKILTKMHNIFGMMACM